MLSLADKYWQWRTKLAKKKELYRKYKTYMWQAKLSKDSPLYPRWDYLTKVILEAADTSVLSRKEGEHYSSLTFENGTCITFWTSNQMYAYAGRGDITVDGVQKTWDKRMPEFYVCFLLKDLLENP